MGDFDPAEITKLATDLLGSWKSPKAYARLSDSYRDTTPVNRTFETPVGLFTYTRVPQRLFLAGVRRVSLDGGGAYLRAIPLKALADLIHAQRLDWHSAAPVVESLRVVTERMDRVETVSIGAYVATGTRQS